jgi:hypothetical protein
MGPDCSRSESWDDGILPDENDKVGEFLVSNLLIFAHPLRFSWILLFLSDGTPNE